MNNYEYEMYLNNTSDEFNKMFLNNMQNQNNPNNMMPNTKPVPMPMPMPTPTPNNIDSNLFSPHEGFIRGNLFRNLYDPYKNFKPAELSPTNKQEEDMLNLSQLQFAMHEANLYLDNFPDDRNMIRKFNEYRRGYDEALQNYESNYGPISINNDYMQDVPFAWTTDAWPWDRRNS